MGLDPAYKQMRDNLSPDDLFLSLDCLHLDGDGDGPGEEWSDGVIGWP